LDEWIYAACVSELDPFIRTALTLDTHREYIANAITLQLSNARREGMNSTARMISHRGRGGSLTTPRTRLKSKGGNDRPSTDAHFSGWISFRFRNPCFEGVANGSCSVTWCSATLPSMSRHNRLRGTVVQSDLCRWAPLERVVGSELAQWFIWTHQIRLDDGTRLDAYKHVVTWRYLHLSEDGASFLLCLDSTYRRADPAAAVATAFDGWDDADPSASDQQALIDVLRRLRAQAA